MGDDGTEQAGEDARQRRHASQRQPLERCLCDGGQPPVHRQMTGHLGAQGTRGLMLHINLAAPSGTETAWILLYVRHFKGALLAG